MKQGALQASIFEQRQKLRRIRTDITAFCKQLRVFLLPIRQDRLLPFRYVADM